jgi:hypothetical protein
MVADQKASQARFIVAEQERQEFKGTLRTLISGETDPKKRSAAIESYVALLDSNDTVRKDNPIPTVPTKCR